MDRLTNAEKHKLILENDGSIAALRGEGQNWETLYMAQIRADPNDPNHLYFSPVRDIGGPMAEELMPYEQLNVLMIARDSNSRDLLSAEIRNSRAYKR